MKECYWVKPKLVCQVAFLESTDAGHLRHCSFVAIRDDNKPAEVVREPMSDGLAAAWCASITACRQGFNWKSLFGLHPMQFCMILQKIAPFCRKMCMQLACTK